MSSERINGLSNGSGLRRLWPQIIDLLSEMA